MKNQNSFNNNLYIFMALSFLVFLALGVAFILDASKLNKEETISYIQTATEQTRFAVDEYIQDEFNALKAAAKPIVIDESFPSEDLVRKVNSALEELGSYYLVGLSDPNGQVLWICADGTTSRGDFFEKEFLNQVLAGESILNNAKNGFNADDPALCLGIPLYRENALVGALVVAIPADEMRNVIDHSLYAGRGMAHIINRQGSYVVRSNSPLRITDSNSIFDVKPPLPEKYQRNILGTMAQGEPGYFERSVYKENRLVAYTPLTFNDWYVFYAVPENQISAGIRLVSNGAIFLIVLAVALFICFIFLLRKINNRGREELEKLAFEDPLTRMWNYRKFVMDAEKLLSAPQRAPYALWYGDIKEFKNVNDIFGRDIGNQLLCYFADIVRDGNGENEFAARIGGDKFAALRLYTSKEEILKIFEKDARRLAFFPPTASHGYKVVIHTGVYILNPEDGQLSIEDMMDRAITAQKTLKSVHNGKMLAFYSNDMRERKLWETEMESTMEIALENQEFQVYFQPKIDIQNDDRIMGMEALVRWESLLWGAIPPAKFIDLFERNGFIVKLDRYIFEQSCRFYYENMASFCSLGKVLSVNVSRLGLLRPDFIETYSNIKESFGIPDGCLELEFTESLAFENSKLFKSVVEECQKRGFLCSMDDFGSGYSSLNILSTLRVDILKIDRLFFQYEEDDQRGHNLVASIISMAKTLGVKTVAEGVEKAFQVEQLRKMGCDAIQGYYFAKPLSDEEFCAFSQQWEFRCSFPS